MADVSQYIELITSEHAGQANFVATVSASVQPFADLTAVIQNLYADFDLDVAVGVQEDAVGVRVGRGRFLQTPLDIFFEFGVAGHGWGQGVWKGRFDSATGLTRLYDDAYRILLYATVVANHWDGTVPGAYEAWDTVFGSSLSTGTDILVQDYGNSTMAVALIGAKPDVITQALFTSGELDLKPAGILLSHVLPTVYPAGSVAGVVGTPLFGFGVENANIAGFGVGAWAKFFDPE